MGSRGPLPKRAIERRRRNVSGDVDTVVVIGTVEPPPITIQDLLVLPVAQLRALARERGADVDLVIGKARKSELVDVLARGLPKWHRIALDWMQSLKTSGQAVYYEPSDWAAAVLVAESMTRLLNKRSYSAELFAAVWKGMTDLLTTEAARRRARIEIERATGAPPDDAKVSAIDDYRRTLDEEPADDEDDE